MIRRTVAVMRELVYLRSFCQAVGREKASLLILILHEVGVRQRAPTINNKNDKIHESTKLLF